MRYETVIGLEVHVELATKSKIFCSCSAHSYGAEPNEHVCPACCGMPGMLPVVNKRVVDYGMKAGLMLACDINRTTTFDKKSYYYPDLPAAYQTTQWFAPVAINGLASDATNIIFRFCTKTGSFCAAFLGKGTVFPSLMITRLIFIPGFSIVCFSSIQTLLTI